MTLMWGGDALSLTPHNFPSFQPPVPTHGVRPISPVLHSTPYARPPTRLYNFPHGNTVSVRGAKPPSNGATLAPAPPSSWASLSPDFAACANGKQQSPIDITGYQAGGPGPISFSYATVPRQPSATMAGRSTWTTPLATQQCFGVVPLN